MMETLVDLSRRAYPTSLIMALVGAVLIRGVATLFVTAPL